MSDNALLLGAIAVGLTIAGVGVTYVIDYEKRISLLESRLDALTGISAAQAGKEYAPKETGANTSETGHEETLQNSTSFTDAIAEGCSKLISSYNSIAGGDSYISGQDQEQLDALKAQMDALGCTIRTKEE